MWKRKLLVLVVGIAQFVSHMLVHRGIGIAQKVNVPLSTSKTLNQSLVKKFLDVEVC